VEYLKFTRLDEAWTLGLFLNSFEISAIPSLDILINFILIKKVYMFFHSTFLSELKTHRANSITSFGPHTSKKSIQHLKESLSGPLHLPIYFHLAFLPMVQFCKLVWGTGQTNITFRRAGMLSAARWDVGFVFPLFESCSVLLSVVWRRLNAWKQHGVRQKRVISKNSNKGALGAMS